ncbi:hypothetical protein GCM10022380_88640 [Amycolatopsis tucumanensis]|uniref:Uncharacterized protein n=1 Tax=Amycolatopsis tucumanensis TaxID=401106 RepID=A0ABP7JX32_9PSEU
MTEAASGFGRVVGALPVRRALLSGGVDLPGDLPVMGRILVRPLPMVPSGGGPPRTPPDWGGAAAQPSRTPTHPLGTDAQRRRGAVRPARSHPASTPLAPAAGGGTAARPPHAPTRVAR